MAQLFLNQMEWGGYRFGRWVVIGPVFTKDRKSLCLCRCDCGTERNVVIHHLVEGKSRSCGCLRIEQSTKHGLWKTPEFRSWSSALSRCYNKNDGGYANYGGRGITVCEVWRRDFFAFYKYIGSRPSPKHSLDRINVNKGYEPGNVRWATIGEQMRNRRMRRSVENFPTEELIKELKRRGILETSIVAVIGGVPVSATLKEMHVQ